MNITQGRMENVGENSSKTKIVGIVLKVLIALLLVVEIYPIVWLLLSSVKGPTEFSTSPVYALPKGFYFKNYIDAWNIGKMSIFFKNSLFVTSAALVVIIVFSATAAFAITKLKWKLSKSTLTLFLMGIMVPVQVVLIPLFMIYKKSGLLNNPTSLIITYAAFGLPMSIYLFVAYFKNIPLEIMEAAVMDGCSIYGVFLRIILPLIQNAIVTVLTLQFLFNWNDLIFSMTFISKTDLKTIQTGMMMFTGQFGQKDWGPIFASITMGTLPTLLLYIVLNKMVIKGMTAGAVKG